MTDPNGLQFTHFTSLRWFNDDSQPDFAILHMPTIILAYTASLFFERCQSTVVSGVALTNLQQRTEYCSKEIVGWNT